MPPSRKQIWGPLPRVPFSLSSAFQPGVSLASPTSSTSATSGWTAWAAVWAPRVPTSSWTVPTA